MADYPLRTSKNHNISIEPTHLQSHTDLFNLQRNGVPTGAV